MRTIERSTKFKKDFKRELKGRYRETLESELKTILVVLMKDETLDARYRDHDLSGNWAGYRECHIKPDLLLIIRNFKAVVIKNNPPAYCINL